MGLRDRLPRLVSGHGRHRFGEQFRGFLRRATGAGNRGKRFPAVGVQNCCPALSRGTPWTAQCARGRGYENWLWPQHFVGGVDDRSLWLEGVVDWRWTGQSAVAFAVGLFGAERSRPTG